MTDESPTNGPLGEVNQIESWHERQKARAPERAKSIARATAALVEMRLRVGLPAEGVAIKFAPPPMQPEQIHDPGRERRERERNERALARGGRAKMTHTKVEREKWLESLRNPTPEDDADVSEREHKRAELPSERARREWLESLRAGQPDPTPADDADVSERERRWIIRNALRDDLTMWCNSGDAETESIRAALQAERRAERKDSTLAAVHAAAHAAEYQAIIAADSRREYLREYHRDRRARIEAGLSGKGTRGGSARFKVAPKDRREWQRQYRREWRARKANGLPGKGTRSRRAHAVNVKRGICLAEKAQT